MSVDNEGRDERQARFEALRSEFREAQRRRLVKRGVELWNRTEREQHGYVSPPGGEDDGSS
jgi:hypothetical protein